MSNAPHPESELVDSDDFNAVSRSQIVARLGVPDLAVNTHSEQRVLFTQDFTGTVHKCLDACLNRSVHSTDREKINSSREDQDRNICRKRDRHRC